MELILFIAMWLVVGWAAVEFCLHSKNSNISAGIIDVSDYLSGIAGGIFSWMFVLVAWISSIETSKFTNRIQRRIDKFK